jgi:hypothetical protein
MRRPVRTVNRALPMAPRTRAECKDGPRPCPWIECRHNLMDQSCVLDLVEEHPDGMTLEQIGERLKLTREAVRKIEAAVLAKLRGEAPPPPPASREHLRGRKAMPDPDVDPEADFAGETEEERFCDRMWRAYLRSSNRPRAEVSEVRLRALPAEEDDGPLA